ncbi:hypothetical protein D1872_289480 [compost metagenome]
MRFHEFLCLDKHTPGTTARVVNSAFKWLNHFNKKFYNTTRRIELSTALSKHKSELAKEIFIDTPKRVFFNQQCIGVFKYHDNFANSPLVYIRT